MALKRTDVTKGSWHPSFHLDDGHIDIWCVDTNAEQDIIRRLASVLSSQERERAARFRFRQHCDEFIAARGFLRILLARYLELRVRDVVFVYGPRGKPSLPDSPVEFNLSHTEGVAIFGFVHHCAVGVDIERVRPLADMMAIADRFFCPAEADELAALDDDERPRAFFRCWTRKEAYIKAIGNGLCTPLDEFRVTLKSAEPARFLHIGHSGCAAREWILHNVDIADGYAAALAHKAGPRPWLQSPLLAASAVFDITGSPG
jgi:4'-phosphopantetheinyl transferase